MIHPGFCQTPIGRPLPSQGLHLYVYAVRTRVGGGREVWSGPVPFCVTDDRFQISGGPPCAGGAQPVGFASLDHRGASTWTFDLTGPNRWATLDQARIAGIQRLLSLAGYDPGPIDGYLGGRTLEALRRFQRAIGLGRDVRLTPLLMDALNEAAPSPAGGATPF